MKRLYNLILIFYVVLVAFTSLLITNTFIKNKIFFKDSESISIFSNADSSDHQFSELNADDLDYFINKNNIILTKLVWNSKSELSIYTNDISLNDWNQSSITTLDTTEYLTNDKDKSDFNWVDNREHVKVYSIKGLETLGIEGEYTMRVTDSHSFDKFKVFLKKSYGLSVKKNNDNNVNHLNVLKASLSQPLLLLSNFILVLILLCSLLFIYIQNLKKVSIQILSGYSFIELILNLFYISLKSLVLAFGLSILFIGLYMFFVLNSLVIFFYMIALLAFEVAVISMIILLLTGIWLNIIKKKNINEYLKNKKNYNFLLISSKVFQLCFLFIIPYIIVNATHTLNELRLYTQSDKSWEQTQDVYATSVQYLTDSYMERRPYETQLKNFYRDNISFFSLINIDNYDLLASGTPIYKANTTSSLEERLSPDGRGITVNPTYLEWNPIYDMSNKQLTESDFIFNDNALNLLVPIELKSNIKEIENLYYEDFIFKTYTIPDEIYEEDTEKVEPVFNIIYVKNNQKYFGYNSEIQANNNNYIVNPIVTVDVGNFDASFYHAWFTNYIYFKKNNEKTGYETLQPLTSKYFVNHLIQLVSPIYNDRADEISKNKRDLSLFILCFVLIIFSLVLCIIYFSNAVLEKNGQKTLVKLYSGYTPLTIYGSMYFKGIALDIAIYLFSSYYFNLNSNYTLISTMLLLLIEFLCISYKINNKTIYVEEYYD